MKFGAKWPLSACMSDVMKLPADNAILHKIILQLIFKKNFEIIFNPLCAHNRFVCSTKKSLPNLPEISQEIIAKNVSGHIFTNIILGLNILKQETIGKIEFLNRFTFKLIISIPVGKR